MKISARNQIKGTVSNVAEGAVNGVVTIDLGDNKIKADITVCYHNHAMGENDIDSDPGDTAVTFPDVTLTNYGGNMEYHGDISSVNQDGSVVVVFHVKGSVLTAEVTQSWVDPADGKTKYEYRDGFDMKLS